MYIWLFLFYIQSCSADSSFKEIQNLSNAVCKAIDSDLNADVLKLTRVYESKIRDAAQKVGVDLGQDGVKKIVVKILSDSSQKSTGCKFKFIKKSPSLAADSPDEKRHTYSSYLKNYIENTGAKNGPFFNIVKVPPVEDVKEVKMPALTQVFEDCEYAALSALGAQQYQDVLSAIQTHLKSGGKIKKIEMACSASTLKNNTCKNNASQMTHLKLSQMRCDFLKSRVSQSLRSMGMMLDSEQIALNFSGENGDGTSGPLPPATLDQPVGLNPNTKARHTSAAEYEPYKFTRMSIFGTLPSAGALSFFTPEVKCDSYKAGESIEKRIYQSGVCPALGSVAPGNNLSTDPSQSIRQSNKTYPSDATARESPTRENDPAGSAQ